MVLVLSASGMAGVFLGHLGLTKEFGPHSCNLRSSHSRFPLGRCPSMEGRLSPLSCGSNFPQQGSTGFVRASSAPVYEVGRVVGEGANAVVYQCHDMVSGDVYAYKCPRSPRRTQMSSAEVAAAARISLLRHVNVVAECPSPNGGAMMEYIDGGTLREALLKHQGPFDDEVASGFLQQILQGLTYLHSKEVVHGDIKCSNVLLEASTGTCKLSDIGRVGDEGARHLNGVLLPAGTPAFMAPEVVRSGTHSKSSDIWSIGCTALEMLTGDIPWPAEDTRFSAMFKIAQGHHPPIPGTVSDLAKDFMAHCFHREPEKRPTAASLLTHRFSGHSRASQVRRTLLTPPSTDDSYHQPHTTDRPRFLSSTGKSQSLKISHAHLKQLSDLEDEDCADAPILVFRRCASAPSTAASNPSPRSTSPSSPRRGAVPPMLVSPRSRSCSKRVCTAAREQAPPPACARVSSKLSSPLASRQPSPTCGAP